MFIDEKNEWQIEREREKKVRRTGARVMQVFAGIAIGVLVGAVVNVFNQYWNGEVGAGFAIGYLILGAVLVTMNVDIIARNQKTYNNNK